MLILFITISLNKDEGHVLTIAMSWDCLSIIWWLIHKAAVVGQNIDQLPGSSKYSILINYPDPPEPQEWGLMSSRKTEEVVDREIVSSYCLLSLLWIELSFGEFSTFVFCQERGGRLAKWGPEGAFKGHQHHFQFSTNSKGDQHLLQKWGLLALSSATVLPSDPP